MDGHPAEMDALGTLSFPRCLRQWTPVVDRGHCVALGHTPRGVNTQALGIQPQRSPLKETWSRSNSHRHENGCRNILLGVVPACGRTHSCHPTDLHPASDYKCFNNSNVSIRPWSWNYRSCWHQTCPPVDTHHCVWIASITSFTHHRDRRNCCSSSLPHQCISMGQFACLLPALAVVAVSQAPSPESNPDSPLPVSGTVGQCPTVDT